MRLFTIMLVLTSGFGAYAIWQGTTTELEPAAFAKALEADQDEILIDLRPARQFAGGHIPGAMNIDWGSSAFRRRIAELDKECAVFLYCRDAAYTADAAVYLRSQGFASITTLKGGWLGWRSAELPETPEELIPPSELTLKELNRLLDLEHLVIVDFYIPWDKHCRRLEPVLDDLAIDYRNRIRILRINTDTYKYLATEMGIDTVPVLQFYENGNLVATIEGAVGRDWIEGTFMLRDYTISAR